MQNNVTELDVLIATKELLDGVCVPGQYAARLGGAIRNIEILIEAHKKEAEKRGNDHDQQGENV